MVFFASCKFITDRVGPFRASPNEENVVPEFCFEFPLYFVCVHPLLGGVKAGRLASASLG